MPSMAPWKRWAFVLLPATVLAISLSNIFHGHAQKRSEMLVSLLAGLLTVMGIAQFMLAKMDK